MDAWLFMLSLLTAFLSYAIHTVLQHRMSLLAATDRGSPMNWKQVIAIAIAILHVLKEHLDE